MGCGCNKKRTVAAPPSEATLSPLPTVARQASSQIMYDVNDASGALVASYSNPVTARAEARRSNGNVVPRGTTNTLVGNTAGNTE